MDEKPLQTIERVNARLAVLLREARSALHGERDFDAESVRQLRATIEEMAPIVAQSAELRRTQPEMGAQLDHYKAQLRELQATTTHIKVMLLIRRAKMQSGRAHVESVSQWAKALSQTRL